MTTFYFLDGRDADPESKRLMRRHVMKGKNAGKRVHRGSRLALQKARALAAKYPDNPLQPVVHYSYQQRVRDMNWIYLSLGSAARSFGNVLQPFSLPFEVTVESLSVINKFFTCVVDRLYPAYLGLSLHDAKLMWLKLLSTDAETNVCSLHLMRSCIEYFVETGNASSVPFHHLSEAFTIINRRLQGKDALSNASLVLVMFLVNHEYIRKEYSAATTHLEGLVRMIDLRGGLEQVEKTSDRYLMLKLCKTDVIYCLQFGVEPRFSRDRFPEVRKMLQSQGVVFKEDFTPPPGLHPDIACVLKDVMEVCELFNAELGRSRTLDSGSHLEIVISVFYRLLSYSTLLCFQEMPAQDAIYHTGLLTLMVTIFLPRYGNRIIPYEPIAQRIRYVIGTLLVDEHSSKEIFWLMMMCCIWLAGEADAEWLALRTRDAAKDLGIETWEHASAVLENFPWLVNFHGDVGPLIWKSVLEGHLHEGI